MRHSPASKILLCVIGLAVLQSQSSARAATDQVIAATTYLRPGPGNSYTPIDEVLTGTRVAVATCDKGWCRITYDRGAGYVPQASLGNGDVAAIKNPTCFLHAQAGYHGSRDMAICHSGAHP